VAALVGVVAALVDVVAVVVVIAEVVAVVVVIAEVVAGVVASFSTNARLALAIGGLAVAQYRARN
jgi:hypothetical protein